MDPNLFRQICGALASVIGIAAYFIYLRGIFRDGEKPHLFSWFLWGVLTLVIWYVQFIKDAGPGAWMTLVTAVFCLFIAACAWHRGEKKITRSDWAAFLGGLAVIPLWYFTKDPLYAVLLLTTIDIVGLYPSVRKTLLNPWQENLQFHAITAVKYFLGLLAIENMSMVNWFYAATMLTQSLVLFTGLFILRQRTPRRA